LNTLYALLFTLPGIPSVYYGSEWGISGVKENGCDQTLRPYINIDKRSDYSTALTAFISKLILLRQREKALKYGSYKQVYLEYMRPFIFERSYENERIIIAVNISNNDEYINLSAHCKGSLFDVLLEENINNNNHILIKPHSVIILKE